MKRGLVIPISMLAIFCFIVGIAVAAAYFVRGGSATAQGPQPQPTTIGELYTGDGPAFGAQAQPVATTLGGVPWSAGGPDALRALDVSLAETRQQIIAGINARRTGVGLLPVAENPLLDKAAQDFAQYLSTCSCEFSHYGPNNMSPYDRMRQAGYSKGNGEIAAGGQKSVAEVVEAWWNSQGHRNIMLGSSGETGAGYVYVPGSQYGYYWVVDFGNVPGCCTGGPIATPIMPATPTIPPWLLWTPTPTRFVIPSTATPQPQFSGYQFTVACDAVGVVLVNCRVTTWGPR